MYSGVIFRAMVLVSLIATPNGIERDQESDLPKLMAEAKISLIEIIEKCRVDAPNGVVIQAEFERDKQKIVVLIDLAIDGKKSNRVYDALDGKFLESEMEDEDHSKTVAGAKILLEGAVKAALVESPGKAAYAEFEPRGNGIAAKILIVTDAKVRTILVDAADGSIIKSAHPQTAPSEDVEFTDVFGEDKKDLATSGANPFFNLEPGYFLELSGKEEGSTVTSIITVLDETKTIDGVETRVVEDRESVDGKLKEITRDYYVISRRTNNVYYFGEDVDVYEGDTIVSHEGSWLAGKDGARYGLAMPGSPMIGARYCQEVAPGVAMDRAEIAALKDRFECPAGKFDNVLRITETDALKKGERENKHYARNVGCIHDGEMTLVRFGKKAR